MGRKRQTEAAEQPEPVGPAVEQVIKDAQERQPGEDVSEPERKPLPARLGRITHAAAGVRLFENRQGKKGWQMEIEFAEKPDKELMDAMRPKLKETGFRWDKQAGENGAWVARIDRDAGWRTRADAERLTDELAGMVAAHKALSDQPAEQGRAR